MFFSLVVHFVFLVEVLFTSVCGRSSIVLIYTTDMNSCKGHTRFASLGEGGRAGRALPSSLLRSSPLGDSTRLPSPPAEAVPGSSGAACARGAPDAGAPKVMFCLTF